MKSIQVLAAIALSLLFTSATGPGFAATASPASAAAPEVVNSTEALQRAEESIVRVLVIGKTWDGEYLVVSSGSGFVVAPGKVVTNFHVVDTSDSSDFWITDYAYAVIPSSASQDEAKIGEVVATWEAGDMALIAAEGLKMPPIAINVTMHKNDKVEAMGYPAITDRLQGKSANDLVQPSEVFVSHGNIALFSAKSPSGQYNNTIFHTASINPGNSGGPLLNGCGQVIGINTWMAKATVDSDGISTNSGQYIATRSDEIVKFLQTNNVVLRSTDAECIAKTAEEIRTEAALMAKVAADRAESDRQLQQERNNSRTMLTLLIGALIVMGLALTGAILYLARRRHVDYPAKPFVSAADNGETVTVPAEPPTADDDDSRAKPDEAPAPPAAPPAAGFPILATLRHHLKTPRGLAIAGAFLAALVIATVMLWPKPPTAAAPAALPQVVNLICEPDTAASYGGEKLQNTDFVFEAGRQCVNGRTPYERTPSGDYVRYMINTTDGRISRLSLSADTRRFSREDFVISKDSQAQYVSRLKAIGKPACAGPQDAALSGQLSELTTMAEAMITASPYQKVVWQCRPR